VQEGGGWEHSAHAMGDEAMFLDVDIYYRGITHRHLDYVYWKG
jgi:hypothetical protein